MTFIKLSRFLTLFAIICASHIAYAAVIAEQDVKDTMLTQTGNPRQDFAPGILSGELNSITLSLAEIASPQANRVGFLVVCFDDFPLYNRYCSGEGETPYLYSNLQSIKGGQKDYTITFPPGFVFNPAHAYVFILTGDETLWGVSIFGSRDNVHNGDVARNLYLNNGFLSPYNEVGDLAFTIRTTASEPTLANFTQDSPEGTLLTSSTIHWSGTLTDPNNQQVKLETEIRSVNEPFNETETDKMLSSDFVSSGGVATITSSNLPNGHYHVRARTVSIDGRKSLWQELGIEGNTDFIKGNIGLEKTFGNGRCFPSSGNYGNFGMQNGFQKHGEIFSIPDIDILKSITIGFASSTQGNLLAIGNNTDGVKMSLRKYADINQVIAESNIISAENIPVINVGQSTTQAFLFDGIKLNPNERYVFLLERTGSYSDDNRYMNRAYTSFIPDCAFRGDAHYIMTASASNYLPDNHDPLATTDAMGFQINYVTAPPSSTLPVDVPCTQNCVSNVLFLPGIMGSRLVDATGEVRWLSEDDTEADFIRMNPDGTSALPDIVAKDATDTADFQQVGTNIYKSFLNEMKEWEEDYHITATTTPYDWRLDYDTVVNNGRTLPNGNISYLVSPEAGHDPYILETLKTLAANSPTGKVTIIGHSQGGLIAKALMQKIGATTTAELIDKVILVATPQLGTPKAVGGLLNGFDTGILGAISAKKARQLAQNFPSAYNLLPSQNYFTYVQDPVITVSSSTLHSWSSIYGDTIHSISGMDNFMADIPNLRIKPAYSDLKNPEIVDATKLLRAHDVHASLDSWTSPEGVQLTTIAGWGMETLSGIAYRNIPHTVCSGAEDPVYHCWTEYEFSYDPQTVIDGDGTVVEPSALWGTGINDTRRYWVNLPVYNKENLLEASPKGRDHKNILEVPTLRTLIKNVLVGTTTQLQYISTSAPAGTTTDPRLHFTLHSPLTLGFKDTLGNYTGSTATSTLSNIPGVTYERYGEVQWLSIPKELAGQLILQGTGTGSFTLDAEEVNGNEILSTTSFEGIPSSTSTMVTMDIIPTQSVTASSTLLIDHNGDGTIDLTLEAKENAVVTPTPPVPTDTTAPEALITFSTTTNAISIQGIDESGTTTLSATTAFPVLKKNQKQYNGIATTTVTIKDVAGNTTLLTYTEKLPSPERRDIINFISITYNGATSSIPSTLRYKWNTKPDGAYKLFATYFATSTMVIESHFRPKKNITVIMQKPIDDDDMDTDDDVDTRPVKTKLTGLIIPTIITNRAKLNVSY